MFNQMDADKDELLTPEEWVTVMKKSPYGRKDEVLEKLDAEKNSFEAADTNGDGKVSKDEYRAHAIKMTLKGFTALMENDLKQGL